MLDEENLKKDAKLAKSNLLKIGIVLSNSFANDGRGRPSEWGPRDIELYIDFSNLERKIGDFLAKCEASGDEPYERPKLFKAEFPHLSQYAVEAKRHRSAKEIAKAIVCGKHGISKRELLTILKSTKEMLDRTRAFRPKK